MIVLHLGSFSSQHTQMAAISYRLLNYDVIFINTKKDCIFEQIPGLNFNQRSINPYIDKNSKIGFKFIPTTMLEYCISSLRFIGFHDKLLKQRLEQIQSEVKVDLVVSTWGYPVIEATLLCQKIFKEAVFVHNILTIPDLPISVSSIKKVYWNLLFDIFTSIQNRAYKRLLRNCDLRLHATAEMLNYVKKKYNIQNEGNDVVRLERFPNCYFPSRKLARLSEADGIPNVVHLGATNFATGMTLDDVSEALIELSINRIRVHFYADNFPVELDKGDKNFLQTYDRFDNNEDKSAYSTFLTQFDAIIMLYNVTVSHERFVNSLPTRFLFGLIVGIPIVLPKDLFSACENYIMGNKIGFAYESAEDLFEKLSDKNLMESIRKNASLHSRDLSFESNCDDYITMVEGLMKKNKNYEDTVC